MSSKALSYSYAKRHQVLLQPGPEVLYTQATGLYAILEVQRLSGQSAKLTEMDQAGFDQLLGSTYDKTGSSAQELADGIGDNLDLDALADLVPETEDLMEQEDEAPIIRLLNSLLSEAIRQNASDIHIETFESKMVVRFRVDGVLQEVVQPKRTLAPLLVSRIKVMAKLDIAEKRIPQDGRIALKVAGREVDIRVSTMPASDGERIVLRLLDKQAGRLDFEALGMGVKDRERLSALLHRPHGILLVTGPTGSGKSTTLYAGLTRIEDGQKNILTIEDPIEYNLEGIGQTQVNLKTDMTFARGLRAMLRQDPDVVMVGEIRDLETAQIAIQASLTGHLVLSTLHTNTAVGAITRMEDMGVEPFLLSSSLVGVLAQRLVRTLCTHCRQPHIADASECDLLKVNGEPPTIYRASGCEHCNHQGYRGRTGIYELLVVDDTLRTLIHNQASEAELTDHVRRDSASIFSDGCARVLAGDTTIEEILRVTQEV
ncbi:type II secretion system ATPase GspE [Porticoccus sp. W117]|uniref:type II secretion system ATPase GspE n=1 Tax=Porticoccus sp. W117 TaxID=3054777 RepID=UPI002594A91A|nr:type II secretion system ATPase GspE [Porticoccus sp. W117]MDM3872570.1 type II secretion system ATPase GspE [Porticoccus sp. W117]